MNLPVKPEAFIKITIPDGSAGPVLSLRGDGTWVAHMSYPLRGEDEP